MAGSQSNGGIVGGIMYLPEGSWDPIDPFIGGPPGIPGSPCPAEPNLFPRLELTDEPTPELGTDVAPAVETPAPAAADGTTVCGGCPA
jgi:hypothetical protein